MVNMRSFRSYNHAPIEPSRYGPNQVFRHKGEVDIRGLMLEIAKTNQQFEEILNGKASEEKGQST